MDNPKDSITITLTEYNRLLKAETFLDALYAAGVDNWSGYEAAQEIVDRE